jgi:alkylation response protein AidB-like acyl-CoA dehydrogenase
MISSLLPAEDVALIRAHAAEAEALGRLHPAVLELIYERQWFKMMAPRKYGGLAWPLPQVVRLEEALSWADGSVGWVVTLCSGAGWFTGFFPTGVFDELFSDPRLCIAGSGTASGHADRDGDGWRVSGRWPYASGALHATAFTANCVVGSGVRPFLFMKEEVRVDNDWKAVGMVATGSHGFGVDGLRVPAERGFVIGGAADSEVLYRYPFLQLAEATLAANACGMAQHFFDCCGSLAAPALEALAAKRKAFYEVLDRSWVDPAAAEGVSKVSRELAACGLYWVDKLYPHTGLGSARTDTEINRVWRDIHTASQHPMLVSSL